MKKKDKMLLIIAIVFFCFMLVIGFIAWNAGGYRKACEAACFERYNLTFIESDYLLDQCYCIYKYNDTRIPINLEAASPPEA